MEAVASWLYLSFPGSDEFGILTKNWEYLCDDPRHVPVDFYYVADRLAALALRGQNHNCCLLP